jgi:hypothetical protein
MHFLHWSYEKLVTLWRRMRGAPTVSRTFSANITASATLVARFQPEEQPKHLDVNAAEGVSTAEGLVLRSPGKLTDGVRVVGEGRSIADDLSQEGTVDFSASGKASQGEDSSIPVCRILREHLNRSSCVWQEPVLPAGKEQGVDCELAGSDGNSVLKVQVVRAEVSPVLRQRLAREGHVAGQSETDALADGLRSAVEHKRTRADRDIVLALDATEAPRYAFAPIVASFRIRHGRWAAKVGFKEIWVVGPIADLVARIDLEN